MTNASPLQLNWRPPLSVRDYPKDAKKIASLGLNAPGIYAMVQRYPRFVGVYIGQTSNLRHRIHEHLRNTVGFYYWIRGDDPEPPTEPGDPVANDQYVMPYPQNHGLGMFNELEANLKMAVREIERTTFYYCRFPDDFAGSDQCDHLIVSDVLHAVEAELIDLTNKAAKTLPTLVCDNNKSEPMQNVVTLNRTQLLKWLEEITALPR